MNQPLISVVIPVYNTASYLRRCLDSIIGQSYNNLEIICINDASTDESNEILTSYKAKDSRIQIISNKIRGGVSAARNQGIVSASGAAVSFIDADDFIHKDYFKILVYYKEKEKADVVACKYVRTSSDVVSAEVFNDDKCRVLTHSQILNPNADDACFKINVWGRIYDMSLVKDNRFCEGLKIAEDTAFNLDVIFKKKDIVFCAIDAPLYYYFCNPNSASRNELQSNMMGSIRDVYLPNMDSYGSRKDLMLEYSVRALLAARYLSMFERQRYSESDGLLKKTWDKMRNESSMQFSKHIAYACFINMPITYRLFRILTDPTMIQWERETKRKLLMKK